MNSKLLRCKLCGQDVAVLQHSHLLPAAAYKLLRGSERGEEDPILGHWQDGGGTLVQTSKQIQDYVFCSRCEHLFNVSGEDYILTQMAVGYASPLFYALPHEPLFSEPDGSFSLYSSLNIPEFDRKELVHFPMGVFFKIAVHRWPVGKVKRKLEFGPYLEPIRDFVLGKAGFPKNTTLAVTLLPPIDGPKNMNVPYEWKRSTCRTYSFAMCGLEFVLSLGQSIPGWLKEICFVTNSKRPVVVSNHTQQLMMKSSMKVIQQGGVKGKLREKLPQR